MLDSQRVAGTLLPLLKFTKECSGLLEQQRGITAKEIRERHSTPRMVIPTSTVEPGVSGRQAKRECTFRFAIAYSRRWIFSSAMRGRAVSKTSPLDASLFCAPRGVVLDKLSGWYTVTPQAEGVPRAIFPCQFSWNAQTNARLIVLRSGARAGALATVLLKETLVFRP